MMECPNLVFIDETPILLYCPQGLSKKVAPYDNIFPNMYKIGQSFDIAETAIVDPSPPQNLDYGFDCYATQAFNAPDGRVLAVSWLGLPDIAYPSDRFDHQGILSLVKELTLKKENSINILFKLSHPYAQIIAKRLLTKRKQRTAMN